MPKPEDRIPDSTVGAIKDMLRKGLFTGLGAALLTHERIQQTLDSLVQEGKVTADEARRMTEELVGKGRQEFKDLQERVLEAVHKGLHEIDVVTGKEREALELRIHGLEGKLQAMEIRLTAMEDTLRKDAAKSGDED
jgi:polyhydroxyalkanoate synthesis regulator phasin